MPDGQLFECRIAGETEGGQDLVATVGGSSPSLVRSNVRGAAPFPDTGDAGGQQRTTLWTR